MNAKTSASETHSKIYDMALTGCTTALMCILGPLSFPIPISQVPVSLGLLAVYFSVYVLGMKRGSLSVVLYLLLGAAGLPVFTGFSGGIGKVLGPTGGYLIGYIFLALIAGFFLYKWPHRTGLHFLGMLLGTAVCYLFGTLWLGYLLHLRFPVALAEGVIPYLPFDLAKMIAAIWLGRQVKMRLP